MSDQRPKITVTRGLKRGSVRRSSGGDGFSPLSLVSGVFRGARKLWWAGLGVLALGEEVGGKVFDALVDRGRSWTEVQRERTQARVRQLRGLAARKQRPSRGVTDYVRETLENILRRANVPHRDDVEELRGQVHHLSAVVDRLSRSIDEGEHSSD